MKNLFFALPFFLLLTFTTTAQTLPKPEFVDKPYVLVKSTNELQSLSTESATMKPAGLKVVYKIQGASSSTVLKADDTYTLILSPSSPALAQYLQVYKAVVKNKKFRQAEIIVAKYGGGINTSPEGKVLFDIKKHSDELYELIPTQPFQAGEYIIVGSNGATYYSFSIQ